MKSHCTQHEYNPRLYEPYAYNWTRFHLRKKTTESPENKRHNDWVYHLPNQEEDIIREPDFIATETISGTGAELEKKGEKNEICELEDDIHST